MGLWILGYLLMDNLGPAFVFAVTLYIAIRALKKASQRRKRRLYKDNKDNSVDENRLLEALRLYFRTDSRLYFDKDVYIEPTDPGNINMNTLGIWMRGEYISTMAEYKKAFPFSYNTFIKMIGDYLKQGRLRRKATNTTTAAEAAKPSANQSETQPKKGKDAQYFLDTLNDLSGKIDEQKIKDSLQETILYLSRIQQIEETFPKCREKTTKLYQYYLPMLVEILENYIRLYGSSSTHEKEFNENEDRLQKTLVLINEALKTMDKELLEDYYTEMNVDMKTLQALLKKDGLASDEGMTFEKLKADQAKTAQTAVEPAPAAAVPAEEEKKVTSHG